MMKKAILFSTVMSLVILTVFAGITLKWAAHAAASVHLASHQAISIFNLPLPFQLMVGILIVLFGVLSLSPFLLVDSNAMQAGIRIDTGEATSETIVRRISPRKIPAGISTHAQELPLAAKT